MSSSTSPRLALHRETVRTLDGAQMAAVNGGSVGNVCVSGAVCNSTQLTQNCISHIIQCIKSLPFCA
ncbi:MAG TPA: hypothetical protein VG245_05335 [Candidatus Dormibacteraeota bacterium]|jgi:hypothetical protein|nr:hypothetical protein [Candidatus Dormibacteraeota bacterium]